MFVFIWVCAVFPVGVTSEGREITEKCPRHQARAHVKKLLSISCQDKLSPDIAILRNSISARSCESSSDNVTILNRVVVTFFWCAIAPDNVRVASAHIEVTLISCPILPFEHEESMQMNSSIFMIFSANDALRSKASKVFTHLKRVKSSALSVSE